MASSLALLVRNSPDLALVVEAWADLLDGEFDSKRQEFDALLTGDTSDGILLQGMDMVDLFLAGKALKEALATL